MAKTLLQSLKDTNPTWDRYLVLVDDWHGIELDAELGTIISIDEIGVPNLKKMAFRYSCMEMTNNVKPWALTYVLDQLGHDRAMYIAADSFVCKELTEVASSLSHSDIVIVPRLTAPLGGNWTSGELDVASSGAYDVGFIALRNTANALGMLSWWGGKLECDGYDSDSDGAFAGRKWVDLVPGMFDRVCILRGDGYGVAYWNLPNREVGELGGKIFLNDNELAFFHFSGLDPERPFPFSRHQDSYNLSTVPEPIESLTIRYCLRVLENEHAKYSKMPYAFDFFQDGSKIPAFARRLYRDVPELERRCGDDPFAHSDVFVDNSLFKIYFSRPDLQSVYPDPAGRDRTGLVRWIVHEAQQNSEVGLPCIAYYESLLEKGRISAADIGFEGFADRRLPRKIAAKIARMVRSAARIVVPRRWRGKLLRLFGRSSSTPQAVSQGQYSYDKQAYSVARPSAGLNVFGYFSAEMGIGEGARALVRALCQAGLDVRTTNVGSLTASLRDREFAGSGPSEPGYIANIWYVNADHTLPEIDRVGRNCLVGHYNIGVWAWELPEFPDEWVPPASVLHEIWAISEFVATSIRKKVDIPVVRIPPAISVEFDDQFRRSDFGIPDDRFVFLSMYDINSVQQRKNPQGAIDAFLREFEGDRAVHLVVKVNSAGSNPDELRRLIDAYAAHGNVSFFAKSLRRQAMNSFMRLTDCFVSLHRAEGFGLGLAESMALGVPVIGTGWSGNMDFMTYENSCPVDYTLVKLDTDYGPYPQGCTWAEPDLEQAARYMRRLVSDADFRETIAKNGQRTVQAGFSSRVVGQMAKQRLHDVGVA